MKVELQIDEKYEETKVVIYTNKNDENISDIVDYVLNKSEKINVYKNEEVYLLKEEEIESIYTEENKVYIKTEKDKFISKKRLYELEELLPKNKFVRISNSEIINFDKVKNLSLNLYGTIKINLISGYSTFVSRRNVKKIKKLLNI